MKIVFLGTGTSIGVPAIGCRCRVCRSKDPRNKRRRASLYIHAGDRHVMIDTPPDFRDQVLTFGVPRLDAVLFTHAHADHLLGFDDVRRFNVVQGQAIPVYGSASTLADLQRVFPYIHRRPVPGLSFPTVRICPVSGPFRIGGLRVEPLPIEHAGMPTYAFKLTAAGVSVGYAPDCAVMPVATLKRLQGVDVMILDALRRASHPTHLSLDQSVALLKILGARKSYITHMGHDLDHAGTQAEVPRGITVPYDGLTLRL